MQTSSSTPIMKWDIVTAVSGKGRSPDQKDAALPRPALRISTMRPAFGTSTSRRIRHSAPVSPATGIERPATKEQDMRIIFALTGAVALAAGAAEAGAQSSNTSSNSSSNNGVVRERIVDTYCDRGWCERTVERRTWRDDRRRWRDGRRDWRGRDGLRRYRGSQEYDDKAADESRPRWRVSTWGRKRTSRISQLRQADSPRHMRQGKATPRSDVPIHPFRDRAADSAIPVRGC
ncbi:hypothetical protein RCO27_00525 [Sphingosinicella sp. LHD-64]|uniref:hypothetical protein n=1 Tax=Sphingosinicella sp. LHD-64 TaxID=3072139 RepID=UPI00280F2A5E|nr:hypothetical protein [Sphingosinicella sp. LHD-64]MDQ8754702.1 hypothetical protein [Sphingosinicella sp. LHD-64]